MAKKQRQNATTRTGTPGPKTVNRHRNPKGFIFILIALLVLGFGFLGYLEYEDVVKPNLEIFICCVPATTIAAILVLMGYLWQVTSTRRTNVRIQPDMSGSGYSENMVDSTKRTTKDDISHDVSKEAQRKQFEPAVAPEPKTNHLQDLKPYKKATISRAELIAQKRSVDQFLCNLDEQHRDGLIMNDVYHSLKAKYRQELAELDVRIKNLAKNGSKKAR